MGRTRVFRSTPSMAARHRKKARTDTTAVLTIWLKSDDSKSELLIATSTTQVWSPDSKVQYMRYSEPSGERATEVMASPPETVLHRAS